MSAEANKAVIQRLFDEVFNHGNLEVIDEIVTEHVLGYDATSPEPKRGFESVKQVVTLFQTAFPEHTIHCSISLQKAMKWRYAGACAARIGARSWVFHQPKNR